MPSVDADHPVFRSGAHSFTKGACFGLFRGSAVLENGLLFLHLEACQCFRVAANDVKALPHDLLMRPTVNHSRFEVNGVVGVRPFVALFVFLTHGCNGPLLVLVAVAFRQFLELLAQRLL